MKQIIFDAIVNALLKGIGVLFEFSYNVNGLYNKQHRLQIQQAQLEAKLKETAAKIDAANVSKTEASDRLAEKIQKEFSKWI